MKRVVYLTKASPLNFCIKYGQNPCNLQKLWKKKIATAQEFILLVTE